jgi:predicted RNase H-like HicB family nuclease
MTERRVILYPGEDGYWVIECPSLPGCVTQGKTREEAIANIKEAIELYIESLQAHGDPIPDDQYDSFLVAI